ncbi:MAG TPA: glutaredoxin domain-containing protein [Bacteroidales bacterium]|nr:glutaredoxin domain-containing protein [Bacteroidales bacterium]HRX97807.1 glutaredoxin domain-containing protein [Bacteroidales bacterium]
MKAREIHSFEELRTQISDKPKAYLLLVKRGSEQSDCSIQNLEKVDAADGEIEMMIADVATVRDIHTVYSVTSVPTMLEFENGRFVNVLKGCHEPNFYKSFFENAVYSAKAANGEETPQKRVTVYSTPTCSWCTTLKTHLKKHNVRFTDVDVSRDQNAAMEMQRKSGQMGVPQTDINGEIIVGFDKTRINTLLGIN